MCKSATASTFNFRIALDSLKSPKTPLCWSFKSIANTSTFFKSLKKGAKKGRVNTVNLTLGYCLLKARNTGTVIATSPIAERRITKICFGVFDIWKRLVRKTSVSSYF